jgi:hypothetical protein
MQVVQRGQRDPWHAHGHAGAGNRIQHPSRHDHNHARCRLDVDELTGGTLLAVMSADVLSIERMPAIVDNDIRLDMGRMTPRWHLAGRMRCLPARTIRLQNTADHPCQGEWVRIAACHHALYGQVVRVLRREWRDGVQLVVEGPDGKRCRLPLTWTDAAAEACLPTLLFAPGALRALVRLVRSHRSSAPQQACHASQQPDAAVEQLPGRNARSDDLALGRSPAPLAGEPRAPRGDAA